MEQVTQTFKDAQKAFDDAIKEGKLSRDGRDKNYAGHYMYMGTVNNVDLFKHSLTREYLQ